MDDCDNDGTQDEGSLDDSLEQAANNAIEVDLTGDGALEQHDSSESFPMIDEEAPFKARGYQLELLDLSIKQNVIVAVGLSHHIADEAHLCEMDTGSGKTHVAVLRMLHQLEKMAPDQFIWFLAPTVALCSQQYDYIESQIANVQVKFLSGADNVDRWSEQSLWNAVLKNVKIVVSTYQILLDALSHAFVKMESLALIVFDEAHNCVGKHPGAKIMHGFYHPRKLKRQIVPDIIGLTASPVMRSSPESLVKIEETLDAICRTPNKYRAELRLQVKLPEMSQVLFDAAPSLDSLTGLSRSITSLNKSFGSLKLSEDPHVISLVEEKSERSLKILQKIQLNHKTWCQEQMKSFYRTTLNLCAELGEWAADYYISKVVSQFTKSLDSADQYTELFGASTAEKLYLAGILTNMDITKDPDNIDLDTALTSSKVKKLIGILIQEPSDLTGIIFVQEKAVVAILARLLSIHPSTRDKYRIGTMIGTSVSSQRSSNIGELLDQKSQKQTLSQFKSGVLNLIIATNVLEEGIDVPACNLVICFSKPANLKSFVQRRGRARHRESKLILLLESKDDTKMVSEWQKLEAVMKTMYEDEQRQLKHTLVIEDTEELDNRHFIVASTGARLDMDNALAHLYHFCATLPRGAYIDPRPDFVRVNNKSGSSIRGRVILPLSVDEKVRVAEGLLFWKSESNAMKDAAFSAYVALHEAGLVDDHLLPLLRHDPITDDLRTSAVETRASIMTVNEQMNLWNEVAKVGHSSTYRHQYYMTLNELGFKILSPVRLPFMGSLELYWDSETTFIVKSSSDENLENVSELGSATEDARALLESAFGFRFAIQEKRPVLLFTPTHETSLRSFKRSQPVATLGTSTPNGLIRDLAQKNKAYIFNGYLNSKPPRYMVQNPYENYDSMSSDVAHVSLTPLTRRMDFLHRLPVGEGKLTDKPFSTVLPSVACIADSMPFKWVQLGLMVPSIMRRFEIYMLAEKLSSTILRDVAIEDVHLIVTAISASSARESTNYQRLEFIGDSVLKLATSIQLTAMYPLWHEGYLSAKKDRLVSNSRLSRAAVESGLDKFIVTKVFAGHKWRPLYIEDLIQAPINQTREMSSKILADVVEALIGAAMVDGGYLKALRCIGVFLPEIVWQPFDERRKFLFQRAPEIGLPVNLQPLEDLIGYSFTKKSLLIQSMSHASCNTGSGSLERFEFLGDSVLDRIVVSALEEESLTHVQMHTLRTILVNADYLGFICMEWHIEQEGSDILETRADDENSKFEPISKSMPLPFWTFMRHNSPKLGSVQAETAMRHAGLRREINDALQNGTHYPWALLARLQALKFYSDIIESLLGAVWIDCGSFEVCSTIVERMGIFPYLRRILRDNVHCLHPKEEIGILADSQSVKYVLKTKKREGTETAENEFFCQIFVGDREVVQVRDGITREEVKTKAAEAAVKILKEEKRLG